jgi:hypothetical protein
MATGALSAQGTLFKIESDSSVGSFTTIPECSKVASPSVKFDLLDATSHDSTGGFKEYVPGLADGENATADLWFIPQNTLHIQLRTDSYAKTKKNFEIIFPGGGTGAQIAFAGYITTITPQADSGTLLKETVTAKVTGQPTWT